MAKVKVIKCADKDLFKHARGDVFERKSWSNMMTRYSEVYAEADSWTEEEKVIYTSEGNDKTHHSSYSMMPGFTCMTNGKFPPCWTSGKCYAWSDIIYPDVIEKAVHNTVLLLKYPEEFRKSYRVLNEVGLPRIHVEGDFANKGELDIVNTETTTITLTYTKKYDLCNKYFDVNEKNKGLQLLYSKWDELEMKNPHHFPECHVYATIAEFLAADGAQKCGHVTTKEDGTYEFIKGDCSVCLMNHLLKNGKGGCYDLKRGEAVDMLAH